MGNNGAPAPQTESLGELQPINVDEAKELIITSQEDYVRAVGTFKMATSQIKQIEEKRKEVKAGILEAGRKLDALASESKAPYERARGFLLPRIESWEAEIKRKQEEAEQAAIAKAKQEAEEKALAEALLASEAGEPEEVVNEILEETTPEPIKMPVPANTRIPGVTRKPIRKAHVVNVLALAKWVVQNPRYQHYLVGHETALNADVKALGDRFNVPGVTVV